MTDTLTKITILAAAVLAMAASAMAAGRLSADTADVYPRGARLVMEVPAEEALRLELPATLDEKTLTVEGVDGTIVRDWSVRSLPAADWLPGSLDDLRGEIAEARSELGLQESRRTSLQQAAAQLETLEPETKSAEEAERFVIHMMKRRETLEQEIRTTTLALEAARDRLKILQELLESRRPAVKDRVLELRAACEGKGNVRIRAWTNQAGWAPRYRMDMNSADGSVSGRLEALVHQKTGLPWEGRVTVHSSRPRYSLDVPELTPLVVDFEEERPYLGETRSMKAMSLAVDETMAPEENRLETVTDVALSAEGSVAGDGLRQALTLETFALAGEMSLVAVPSISPQAWVLWEMEAADRAFLPGRVELSIDGSPSGRTRMPALGAGQPLALAFGTSPLIRTEREELPAREGSSWTGKGRMEQGYAITVTNGLKRSAEVTLKDRIPVSAQEKIRIESVEISPEPDGRDDRGMLNWDLALAAGESATVTVRYRIAYPGDREIDIRD